MAFHGMRKHRARQSKMIAKSKKSDRTRAVAAHQAKVKAVLDGATKD